ncbi:MAG: efflux RND transporter permease subunit [Bryobacterales bacterium]|nr:efflux RND transporter permease subunit [Bryobacterales bacterium]
MSGLDRVVPGREGSGDRHWSALYAKPIIFVILACVAVGIYLARAIPVAVFPETDFPRVVIGVDNGVAPIDQMLVTVTRPIEDGVNTVQGLERVWSITSRGTAEINLFFNWKADMYQTLDMVNAALARIQPNLPPGTKLTTNRLTFAAFPIMGYSLTSDTVPQTDLWEMATYNLKPRLNRLPGVSMVVIQGGQEPEFEVRPDPGKLIQTTTTIPDILDAIGRTNLIDSPGLMEYNHQLVLSLVSGQVHTPAEISGIAVKTSPSGNPVRVGDVATVSPSVKPVYTIVTANEKPAVLFSIYRQPDGNTVTVADAVHGEVERIRGTLPPGVQLRPFYDQSEIVNSSIYSVRDAILLGLILASLIMVLFLRDWGTSLVAGLVIPATIAITFIALRLMGETFNLMTLGGLAAAVGLVIDDAIVVVENIVMHRDLGQTRAEAIRSAIREIRAPLVGSTITPIVVFVPLVAITGVTGLFFRALAVTVAAALLTSLALALTWTPTLSHIFIRRRGEGHTGRRPLWRLVMRLYERVLPVVLRHPVWLGAACVALVAGCWWCYQALGSDLLPGMDEGGFIIDYWSPPGSSLEDTNRSLLTVERILKETPEVESTSRRTGMELGLAAVTEANRGDIAVKLKRARGRSSEEVMSEVRGKIGEQAPTLNVEFVQLLQDMIGDLSNAPEPIIIKLFSEDPALRREWAPRVAEAIGKLPGVVDVMDGIENSISGPAVLFRVDPAATARAGFTPEEIQQAAAAMLQGQPASVPVVLNDRAYPIRVRFGPETRSSLEAIRNTLIVSRSARTATLGSLARLTELPGQTEIRRENLLSLVDVTGRLEGISLGAGMAEVQKAVAALNLPPAIRVTYGGGYEEQQRSFRDLFFVLALAIVLVFIVLLFEFRNFGAPVAVLASALLSTSGVLAALLVTGATFNLSSFMGLIMVIGIVAKNGILLLDADQKYRAAGIPPEESMLRAGRRRLRPIMMTALATVAGMIPLALAWGAGSQMLQPLAIAVIGGILASMVLSLIVTPAVRYYLGAHSGEE